ncbi:DUF3109 family protein [Plebeiibacterium sediminum]|uniref:DUF3109 family protein n=1 Tax=Plebeiibacterium sediminum TaxID=2992112 RepID=A0AAE3M4D5_9BACT|nr:DUF3109 family protein [Plebeiobacterium sediminum]MCW3786669.1 DUF3109 family protein [Plebeiobacterium sediminum]
MIQIDDKIISLELFQEKFICNIAKCKGICCVEGDSGAPLTEDEAKELEEIYPKIKHLLSEDSIKVIEEEGTSVIDFEDELVTPIVNGQECVYTYFDSKGTVHCAIEMAWKQGEVNFRKPISCHLYPIRTKKLTQGEALNYDVWPICADACILGEEKGVSVYQFLKEPLIRKYGEAFYHEMEESEKILRERGML